MKYFVALLLISMFAILPGEVMFVVNSGSETLSRLDTETGVIDNSFASLGSMPNRLECTTESIYVVNSGDNSIGKYDAVTGEEEANIFLESSSNPYDLLLEGEFLYVSGALTNKVYKIDINTDTVVDEVTVGMQPAGMAAANGKLYVGNSDYMGGYNNCSLSVIELSSFTVIDVIETNANPQYLLAAAGKIHISCTGNWSNIMGSVQILDPLADEIVEALPLGGYCGDMAYSTTGFIYVSDAMNTGVYAYEAESWEVVYNYSSPFLPGGSIVEAGENILAVAGGEWGENFTVWLYDSEENPLGSYEAALYCTDINVLPQASVANEENAVPAAVMRAYPNPFFSRIDFAAGSSREEITKLEIYDIKGRKIKDIAGSSWDGSDNAGRKTVPGVYLARITDSCGRRTCCRITLIR